MSHQKRNSGKDAVVVALRSTKNIGKKPHKSSVQYLRGPKDGGPTITERAARQKAQVEKLERKKLEQFDSPYSHRYLRFW